MAYFDLTSVAQIRAVLTVSDADLPDEVIEGYAVDDDLGNKLDKELPTWAEIIEAGGANARRLRLAAKYFCAGTIARMAQVFVLKKDTDGSNEGQRSDKDGWMWISASLLGQAEGYFSEVKEDLKLPQADAKRFTVFGGISPTRDPITTPRS